MMMIDYKDVITIITMENYHNHYGIANYDGHVKGQAANLCHPALHFETVLFADQIVP